MKAIAAATGGELCRSMRAYRGWRTGRLDYVARWRFA